MIPPANNPEFSHGSHAATRGTTPQTSKTDLQCQAADSSNPSISSSSPTENEHVAISGQPSAPSDKLRLAETFVSRQGEGKLTGTESFFIRTSGCNLRCWFCDTPYTSWNPEGDLHTIGEILRSAIASGAKHVVLTGGEPLLPPTSARLSEAIMEAGLHLTVETAGTVSRPVPFDLLSLSPKLKSSAPSKSEHARWNQLHLQRRLPLDSMQALMEQAKDIQVKFVVDSRDDFDEVIWISEKLGVEPSDVWIMPQGVNEQELDAAAEWLRPWARSQAFQFCDRMHIRWYGNRRAT